jgi:hypothetical protein
MTVVHAIILADTHVMNDIEWIVGGDRRTLLKLFATLYACRTALIQGTKVKVKGDNVSVTFAP